jgi:hypothetical protein
MAARPAEHAANAMNKAQVVRYRMTEPPEWQAIVHESSRACQARRCGAEIQVLSVRPNCASTLSILLRMRDSVPVR